MIAAAPTRRTMLSLFAAAPLMAAPALSVTPAHSLLARLDAHDATARRLDASDGSEAAWQAWSADGVEIFDAIERLPRTAANAAVKARAVMSIYSDDDLEDLISDDSTAGRLVLQIVRMLGSH